jgi:hypothetical protein
MTDPRRRAWGTKMPAKRHHIAPGKAVQNAFVKSFNGGIRDERLSEHPFSFLAEARRSESPMLGRRHCQTCSRRHLAFDVRQPVPKRRLTSITIRRRMRSTSE